MFFLCDSACGDSVGRLNLSLQARIPSSVCLDSLNNSLDLMLLEVELMIAGFNVRKSFDFIRCGQSSDGLEHVGCGAACTSMCGCCLTRNDCDGSTWTAHRR